MLKVSGLFCCSLLLSERSLRPSFIIHLEGLNLTFFEHVNFRLAVLCEFPTFKYLTLNFQRMFDSSFKHPTSFIPNSIDILDLNNHVIYVFSGIYPKPKKTWQLLSFVMVVITLKTLHQYTPIHSINPVRHVSLWKKYTKKNIQTHINFHTPTQFSMQFKIRFSWFEFDSIALIKTPPRGILLPRAYLLRNSLSDVHQLYSPSFVLFCR